MRINAKPLAALISGRQFDDFQPGLKSRFRAYRFHYQLTYGEPTDNCAMYLNLESPLHLGRVTAWESGACELKVVEKSSGNVVLLERHELSSEEAFQDLWPKLVLFMRNAVGWPQEN